MKKKILAVLIAVTTLLVSCKKNETAAPKSIYIALTLDNKPAYEKDGALVYLSSSAGQCKSIFVKDGDVYAVGLVAGATASSNQKAVYWKNGVEILLSDNISNPFNPSDIAITANNEIVVSGTIISGGAKAAYWKNGTITTIGPSGQTSFGYCLAVNGNDFYIGGFIRDAVTGDEEATIWKNGTVSFNNPLNKESVIYDIVVNGNDVYAGGWEVNTTTNKGRVTYWKNSVPNYLSDGTTTDEYSAGGLFVSGNDVYVLGNQYPSSGLTINKYYKNNSAVILAGVSTDIEAQTLAVFNNQVYVGGFQSGNKAVIWKDGVLKTYTTANSRTEKIRVF
jgi:hypothetical protein